MVLPPLEINVQDFLSSVLSDEHALLHAHLSSGQLGSLSLWFLLHGVFDNNNRLW